MQQQLEQQVCYGALEKIHLLLGITFLIYYSKKGNVVHFRLILFIFLLAQSLHAKPIIYFILSNDCPICHNLMNDIKSNNNLKALLTNEYQVKIIDTMQNDVPNFLPFEGTVPAIFITNNDKFIGDSLKGYIPSNELMRYLIDIKKYLNENDKRTYYVF